MTSADTHASDSEELTRLTVQIERALLRRLNAETATLPISRDALLRLWLPTQFKQLQQMPPNGDNARAYLRHQRKQLSKKDRLEQFKLSLKASDADKLDEFCENA